MPSAERERADVATVVRLAQMGGAAEAVEACRVRIGAGGEILDVRNAGRSEARRDVARQVEQGMARPGGGAKETRVSRIGGAEALDQVGADLVVRLADHRPERRHDARAL